jgi:hypothetical protein
LYPEFTFGLPTITTWYTCPPSGSSSGVLRPPDRKVYVPSPLRLRRKVGGEVIWIAKIVTVYVYDHGQR